MAVRLASGFLSSYGAIHNPLVRNSMTSATPFHSKMSGSFGFLKPGGVYGNLVTIRSLNTFLPYPNFTRSVQCLDWKRLGKQRVEAMQIWNIVSGNTKSKAWVNAPMVRMWYGYPDALGLYYNECLREWSSRGYKNILLSPVELGEDNPAMPPWLGDDAVHKTHRSNLLRKAPDHYGQFGWTEANDMPYMWPIPVDDTPLYSLEVGAPVPPVKKLKAEVVTTSSLKSVEYEQSQLTSTTSLESVVVVKRKRSSRKKVLVSEQQLPTNPLDVGQTTVNQGSNNPQRDSINVATQELGSSSPVVSTSEQEILTPPVRERNVRKKKVAGTP